MKAVFSLVQFSHFSGQLLLTLLLLLLLMMIMMNLIVRSICRPTSVGDHHCSSRFIMTTL